MDTLIYTQIIPLYELTAMAQLLGTIKEQTASLTFENLIMMLILTIQKAWSMNREENIKISKHVHGTGAKINVLVGAWYMS